MSTLSSYAAVAIIGVSTFAVLIYAALLMSRMENGQFLERLLLRAIVDPQTRTRTLTAISLVNGMFVLIGTFVILANLGLLDDTFADLLIACAFGVGSATLLFQIRLGLAQLDLSLENELELRDTHPEVFAAVSEETPAVGVDPSPLYLAFPLEQSRLYAVQVRDSEPSPHRVAHT